MTKLSKTKTSKHSKILTESPKIATPAKIIDSYIDMMYMKEKPVAIGFIMRLAEEWIAWSLLEDSLRMADFYLERNIHKSVMYRWMEKYDFMKRTHEFVKDRIASRRDKGAITRKYDPHYIDKHQIHYDDEWRKTVEWRASLGDTNKEGSGTIILQMAPAPNSAEVPERKKVE